MKLWEAIHFVLQLIVLAFLVHVCSEQQKTLELLSEGR